MLERALTRPLPRSVVFPGTGKGALDVDEHPRVEYMRRAKQAGFRTSVVHLICPLEVARSRNNTRQRQLPDSLVESTREGSKRLYKQLSAVCDQHAEHDVSAHKLKFRGRSASVDLGNGLMKDACFADEDQDVGRSRISLQDNDLAIASHRRSPVAIIRRRACSFDGSAVLNLGGRAKRPRKSVTEAPGPASGGVSDMKLAIAAAVAAVPDVTDSDDSDGD